MKFEEHVPVKLGGLLDNISIPNLKKVERIFNNLRIENIDRYTRTELENYFQGHDLQNKKIAITIGSRGINELDTIVKSIGDFLLEKGASPFIVPAMGSHANANAEDQEKMVRKLCMTSGKVTLPVKSSMDVVELGVLESGTKVFCDKIAFESDGIIVLNKIKPHADFKGTHESGLSKMMCIGLGKHIGAIEFHKRGFKSFKNLIPEGATFFLQKAPVICGIGIIENAYDFPCKIEVIKPEEIVAREKSLLVEAKNNIAKIGIDNIDVLIIEKIGKDISGEGMDPNVTGRPGSYLNDGFTNVKIDKIVILGVTEISNGNGAGIGMADVTTIECLKSIDLATMYTNSITAGILGPSRLPMALNTEEEAIKIAMTVCENPDKDALRIVRIKNTLHLDEIWVSPSLL